MTIKQAVALTLAFAVLGTAPATAQQAGGAEELQDQLREIYEEADPVERLEAYDALVEALSESSGRPIPEREEPESSDRSRSPATDRWIANVDTDPLSDETVVFMAVPASSGRSRYGDTPLLALRRSGSAEDVYIVWHDYLADESQMIEYRIGEERTQRRGWTVSTDNEATFYPGDVGEFVGQLAGAERFVARTTPYNESPVTAVFDLSGLEELLEEHSGHVGDWAE
ncbi:MAG: hypothetical protein ACOCU4_10025 [Alkalispirochaeta sp.]